MNSCAFTGRLVADATLMTAQTGTQVCRFRLASDVGYSEPKKTNWLNCTLFGNRGQALFQYLKKGGLVTVVGELEPPQIYVSQTGETRASQSFIVRDIALMGGNTAPHDQSKPPPIEYNPNDDVPF